MSIVADITTAILSTAVSAIADSSYQQIYYVTDPSKNDQRSSKLGYGVRPLEASTAEGVNRAYTLNHRFEIVLTDHVTRDSSDYKMRTQLNTMYAKADSIFKAMVNTKLGVSSVLNIHSPALTAPDIQKDVIFIRMGFVVQYRSSLT